MSDQTTKITPADLERKLRALQGDVQDAVDDKKPAVASIAAGAAVVLLLSLIHI